MKLSFLHFSAFIYWG